MDLSGRDHGFHRDSDHHARMCPSSKRDTCGVAGAHNIQPTITIRPGWPLRVIVEKDFVLADDDDFLFSEDLVAPKDQAQQHRRDRDDDGGFEQGFYQRLHQASPPRPREAMTR